MTVNSSNSPLTNDAVVNAYRSLHDANWDWDLANQQLFLSPRWKELLGYDDHELPNEVATFYQTVHPDDLPLVDKALERHFESLGDIPYDVELRQLTKTNQYQWMRARGQAVFNEQNQPVRMVGTHTIIETSVTIRQATDYKWFKTFDQLTAGVWQWSLRDNSAEFSDNWLAFRQLSRSNVTGCFDDWASRVHPDDIDGAMREIKRLLAGEIDIYENKHRALLADGSYCWVLDRGKVMERDLEGNPVRVVGTNIDIQQQEAHAEHNTTLKRRYQTLLHNAPDGILVINLKGDVLESNESAAKLLGYPRARDLHGLNVLHLDSEITVKSRDAIFETIDHNGFTFDTWHRRLDGSKYRAQVTSRRITIDQEDFIYASFKDVTDARETAEQLNETYKRMLGLTENVPGMVYTFQQFEDGHVRFPYSSRQIEDIYGVTPDHVLEDASIAIERIHPKDRDAVMDAVAKSKVQLTEWNDQFRITHPTKGVIWVEGRSQPEAQDDGSVLWYGYITDITEQKRQRLEFKTVFETTTDAIAIIGLTGQLTEFNQAFLNLTGHKRDELMRANFIDLCTSDWISDWQRMIDSALHGETVMKQERTLRSKQYDLVDVKLSMAVLPDQKRLVITLSDNRKETAMRRGLIAARDAALKATEAKSQFLANMSHEIRTPLNGVIGLNQLLLSTRLTNTQRQYLERANESAQALLGIINDILDFSKLETGHVALNPEVITTESVLEKIANLFDISAEQKDIQLQLTRDNKVPNHIFCDGLKLQQILNNLVSNAIKFTEQGRVDVAFSYDISSSQGLPLPEGATGWLQIAVVDTGIGLTKQEQNKLFQQFSQTDDSHARNYGGTGLGLAISKSFIVAMHGGIEVDSTKGKGSTFRFEIPLFPLPAEPQRTESAERKYDTEPGFAPLFSGRVLVVEDNATNQIVASTLLKQCGVEVDIAGNGIEAVEQVERDAFDLILMDLQMPKMDGFEATRAIRKINRQVPIIALSAAVTELDQQNSYDCGMQGHIAKPLVIGELQQMLADYLSYKPVLWTARELGFDYAVFFKQYQEPKQQNRVLQLFAAQLQQRVDILVESIDHAQQSGATATDVETLSSALQQIQQQASKLGFVRIAQEAQRITDDYLSPISKAQVNDVNWLKPLQQLIELATETMEMIRTNRLASGDS